MHTRSRIFVFMLPRGATNLPRALTIHGSQQAVYNRSADKLKINFHATWFYKIIQINQLHASCSIRHSSIFTLQLFNWNRTKKSPLKKKKKKVIKIIKKVWRGKNLLEKIAITCNSIKILVRGKFQMKKKKITKKFFLNIFAPSMKLG